MNQSGLSSQGMDNANPLGQSSLPNSQYGMLSSSQGMMEPNQNVHAFPNQYPNQGAPMGFGFSPNQNMPNPSFPPNFYPMNMPPYNNFNYPPGAPMPPGQGMPPGNYNGFPNNYPNNFYNNYNKPWKNYNEENDRNSFDKRGNRDDHYMRNGRKRDIRDDDHNRKGSSHSKNRRPAREKQKYEVLESHTLFFRSIDYGANVDEFRHMVEAYGPISRYAPKISKRGLAFVTYDDIRDAIRALNELNDRPIKGRELKVVYATKPNQEDGNLYTSIFDVIPETIPCSVPPEKIKNELARFGELRDFQSNPGNRSFTVKYFKLSDAKVALSSNIVIDGVNFKLDKIDPEPKPLPDDEENEDRYGHEMTSNMYENNFNQPIVPQNPVQNANNINSNNNPMNPVNQNNSNNMNTNTMNTNTMNTNAMNSNTMNANNSNTNNANVNSTSTAQNSNNPTLDLLNQLKTLSNEQGGFSSSQFGGF